MILCLLEWDVWHQSRVRIRQLGWRKGRALSADRSFPMTSKKCSLPFCFSFIFTTPALPRLEKRSYLCSAHVWDRAEINCKPKPLSRSSRCPKLIFIIIIIINDIRKNKPAQRADVCLPGPSNASYTAAPAAASQDPDMVLMVSTQQTALLLAVPGACRWVGLTADLLGWRVRIPWAKGRNAIKMKKLLIIKKRPPKHPSFRTIGWAGALSRV